MNDTNLINSLIEESTEQIKSEKYNKAESILLNVYNYSKGNYNIKVHCLILISFLYWKKKLPMQSTITAKCLLNKISTNNDSSIKVVRTLIRVSYLLEQEQDISKALYFMYQCKIYSKNIIEKEIIEHINTKYIQLLDSISDYLLIQQKAFEIKTVNYMKAILEKYYNISTIMHIDNKDQLHNNICNLLNSKETKSNMKLGSQSNYYVLNKNWLIHLIAFLILYDNSNKDQFSRKIYCLYLINSFSNTNSNITLGIFPGPISNYSLINNHILKLDSFTYDSSSENTVVPIELWKRLVDQFNLDNTLSEINYIQEDQLEIKVLFLNEHILKNIPSLNSPRSIRVSKEITMIELKKKILNTIDRAYFKSCKSIQIKMSKILKSQRDTILNITLSYLNTNNKSAIKYIGRDFTQSDDNNLKLFQFFDNINDLLIIEIVTNHDTYNYFRLRLIKEKEGRCKQCMSLGILSSMIKCDKCQYVYFCSDKCLNDCTDHYDYHNNGNLTLKKIVSIIENNQFKHHPGTCGYLNLGNTCYMNSVLHSLTSTVELSKYFLLNLHKNDINYNNTYGSKGNIATQYYNILKEQLLERSSDYIVPHEFKDAISLYMKDFSNSNQHDANEFLSYLLNFIHEDLNKVTKKEFLSINNKTKEETEYEASDRFKEYYLKKDNSIITDLFNGQIRSQINCPECNTEIINYYPFNTLSLCIPDNNIKINIKVFKRNGSTDELIIHKVTVNHKLKVEDLKLIISSMEKIEYENLCCYLTGSKGFKQELEDKTPIHIYYSNLLSKDVYYKGELNEVVFYEVHKQSRVDIVRQSLTATLPIIGNTQSTQSSIKIFIQPIFYNISDSDNKQSLNYTYIKEKSRKPLFYSKPFEFQSNLSVKEMLIILLIYYRKQITNIYPNRTFKEITVNINNRDYIEEEFNLHFEINEKGLLTEGAFNLRFYNYSDTSDLCKFCNKACESCEFSLKLRDKLEKIELITKTDMICLSIDFPYEYLSKIVKGAETQIIQSSRFMLFETINYCSISELISYNSVNIHDCLNKYFEREVLDKTNAWYCSVCKDSTQAIKKLDLMKMPKYLIIQLKRFKVNNTNIVKNEKLVQFPIKNLTITNDYVDNSYNLYSVINHTGNMKSGHYLNYSLNPILDVWYSYDDQLVSEIQESVIVNHNAYILFYKSS